MGFFFQTFLLLFFSIIEGFFSFFFLVVQSFFLSLQLALEHVNAFLHAYQIVPYNVRTHLGTYAHIFVYVYICIWVYSPTWHTFRLLLYAIWVCAPVYLSVSTIYLPVWRLSYLRLFECDENDDDAAERMTNFNSISFQFLITQRHPTPPTSPQHPPPTTYPAN